MSYKDVIKEACRLFDVHERDLLGPAQFNFLIPARFAVCKALVDRGNSQSQVARWMNRNRTTVRNALIKASYLSQHNPEYRAKVKALTQLGAKQ